MQNTQTKRDIGILIHGRHLDAVNWEGLLWGDASENQLGTGPTAVLTMLDLGLDRIKLLTIGSGASRREDGTFEADAIKQFLLSKFETLEDFKVIHKHPAWRGGKATIRRLMEDSVTDAESRNTADEIKNAATLFRFEDVQLICEITGASHGPRCALEQGSARESGIIPHDQRWLLVTDDVPYAGSAVRSTLVVEAPHRGDDPALVWPEEERPANVFRHYYTLPENLKKQHLTKIIAINRQAQEKTD